MFRVILRFAHEIGRKRLAKAGCETPALMVSLLPETPAPWQCEFIRCHYELRGPDRVNILTIAAAILGFRELVNVCSWALTQCIMPWAFRYGSSARKPRATDGLPSAANGRSANWLARRDTLSDLFGQKSSLWGPKSAGLAVAQRTQERE